MSFLATAAYLLWFTNTYLSTPKLFFNGNIGPTVWLFAGYILSFFLMWIALGTKDPLEWDYMILVSLIFTIVSYYLVRLITEDPSSLAATDSFLISNYAANLQMMGLNPYQWDFLDMYSAHRSSLIFQTPLLNGDIVHEFNYPALHFLIMIPFKYLGINEFRTVYIGAVVLTYFLLFYATPRGIRNLALLPFMATVEFINFTLGWVTDSIWMLFMVAAIFAWRKPIWRAVLFGLSIAYKQHPWFLLPYIMMRIWLDDEDADPASKLIRSLKFAAISIGVFLVFNLPYMLIDVRAWSRGIFKIALFPEIYYGTGLSTITQFGIFPFPREYYRAVLYLVMLVLGVVYIVYFKKVKHTLWIYSGIILWFNHRGLQSYFIYWLPIAALVVVEIIQEKMAAKGEEAALLTHHADNNQNSWIRTIESWVDSLVAWMQRHLDHKYLLIGLTLVGFTAITAFHVVKATPIQVEIRDFNFSGDRATVLVKNTTDVVITPVFSVQSALLQPFPWQIVDGPDQLQPGEEALYQIGAFSWFEKFYSDTGGQLVVTDRSGDYRLRGSDAIKPVTDKTREQSWRNPDLLIPQRQSRDFVPLGYNLQQHLGGDDYYTNEGGNAIIVSPDRMIFSPIQIYETEQGFNAAALSFPPEADSEIWESVSLGQTMIFPIQQFSLWVNPPASVSPPGAAMDTIYGLELNDGYNLIWVLFGEGQDAQGQLKQDHYYIYIQAPANEWSQQTIDLNEIYRSLGLYLPPILEHGGGRFDFDTRVIDIRYLLAARHQEPGGFLTASFGPLVIEKPNDFDVLHMQFTLEHQSDYYFYLYERALRLRLYDMAKARYQSAMQTAPEAPAAYYKATYAFLTCDFDSAAQEFQKAADLNYHRNEAYHGLGLSLFALGEMDEAQQVFQSIPDVSLGLLGTYNQFYWFENNRCGFEVPPAIDLLGQDMSG